ETEGHRTFSLDKHRDGGYGAGFEPRANVRQSVAAISKSFEYHGGHVYVPPSAAVQQQAAGSGGQRVIRKPLRRHASGGVQRLRHVSGKCADVFGGGV